MCKEFDIATEEELTFGNFRAKNNNGGNMSCFTGIFKDLSTIHEGELQANLKEI